MEFATFKDLRIYRLVIKIHHETARKSKKT